MINLTEDHKYIDETGREWPGVTSIIQAAGMSNQYNHDPYAATRGTFAHKACHLYDMGELDESTLDDTVRPYFESYKKLRLNRQEKVFHSEKLVYSETFVFAGTLDRVMTDDAWYDIWDLKTGAYDVAHGIQTAAYALAWEEMRRTNPIGRIRYRYGIHLQKNGSIAKMVKHDNRNDKNIFLAAHAVATWIKNERG